MNREDLIMYEYGSSLTGEEKRFIEMDLGKGVDCLGPNYDMLDLQVVPSPSSLAYSTMGCGYCSFKKTVRDWSKISRTMYRNASTPSGRPVSLDIGINGNREKESRMSYTCEGEMVRTKTIRFAIAAPVKEDTINLRRESYREKQDEKTRSGSSTMGDEIGGISGGKIHARPPSIYPFNKSRLDVLISKAVTTRPDKSEMIRICKKIIGEDNRGATHFISSVDLGAKIFYTQKKKASETTAKGKAEIGGKAGASAGTPYTDQSQSRDTVTGVNRISHPEVKWDKTKTVVKPEHEMVISQEVSPVWLLVSDKDWRQAMKEACSQYINENAARRPFPVISTGRPLVISSGKYFLEVREDPKKGFVLEVTDRHQDASNMYIEVPRRIITSPDPNEASDPLKHPDSGFYIYHKTNGIKLYLCADPYDESTVRLATRLPSSNAYSRLYVEHVNTGHLAPLHKWPKGPLHLLRKTAYTRRRQYLVIKEAGMNNQCMVFSSNYDNCASSLFKMQTANTVDPHENKKLF